jgi:hypothetical protein
MKFSDMMKVNFSVSGLVAICALALWIGCQPAQLLIGERSCEAAKWERIAFSTQDVLPGVESNLRATRLYVVRSSEANDNRLPESNWLLMTDSVQIPMGMRLNAEGEVQWSGSRNFYGEVRPGVPVLENEGPEPSGLNLQGESWLIGTHESGCLAVPLPAVQILETIAAP